MVSHNTCDQIHGPIWYSPYLLPCPPLYHTCHFSQGFLFLEHAWPTGVAPPQGLRVCCSLYLRCVHLQVCMPDSFSTLWFPSSLLSSHATLSHYLVLFSPWHLMLSKIIICVGLFVYSPFSLLHERRECGYLANNGIQGGVVQYRLVTDWMKESSLIFLIRRPLTFFQHVHILFLPLERIITYVIICVC